MTSTIIIKNIRIFLIILLFLVIIDSFVINTLKSDIYENELKDIAKFEDSSLSPNIWALFFVYVLIAFALTNYVFLPYELSELNAFLKGSLLGFIIYGIYNFANYSFIKEWSFTLLSADIIWGTVLCGLVAFLTFFVNKLFR